jgi:hypothetical protein
MILVRTNHPYLRVGRHKHLIESTWKDTILAFGKTHELKMADNKIIALSTKMADETPWTSPSGPI